MLLGQTMPRRPSGRITLETGGRGKEKTVYTGLSLRVCVYCTCVHVVRVNTHGSRSFPVSAFFKSALMTVGDTKDTAVVPPGCVNERGKNAIMDGFLGEIEPQPCRYDNGQLPE